MPETLSFKQQNEAREMHQVISHSLGRNLQRFKLHATELPGICIYLEFHIREDIVKGNCQNHT